MNQKKRTDIREAFTISETWLDTPSCPADDVSKAQLYLSEKLPNSNLKSAQLCVTICLYIYNYIFVLFKFRLGLVHTTRMVSEESFLTKLSLPQGFLSKTASKKYSQGFLTVLTIRSDDGFDYHVATMIVNNCMVFNCGSTGDN